MEESFDIIKFKMNSHQQNISTLTGNIQIDTSRIATVDERLKLLDDTKNVLTILKNYKMESKKDFILKTINTALADVFEQNLRVDIEAMSSTNTGKINMKYDIVLYQNGIEMARNEKLLGNNGGGVLSFISILFKIMVGYIYSDNKFYLFDESISQVSSMYRPRLAQFIKKFCAEYGFTIVLISHTDDIDEYADVGYLLDGEFDEDGTPTLKIDTIFGTYPQDKYTYVKVQNFQSIKKLEFRYKGFTVIRGNNNIGKSASFRAINSIIFNSFDVKDHPRKNRPRGAAVKILFGFEDSTSAIQDNHIGLSYTSGKVVYEFNDKTFAGKSLAFDKVKEKVESIGFKYVDLKETYKNFKGNLKDQTERLAMTTQYDGFYLVGNKNNETEKVFNFLFDSTDVANAIATVSLDINELNKELNELSERVKLNGLQLEKEKVLYDIYIRKFYYYMIVEHIDAIKALNYSNHRKTLLQEIIANINGSVLIIHGLENLRVQQVKLQELQSNNLVERYNKINEIMELLPYPKNIETFIVQKQAYNEHLIKKAKIAGDIERVNYELSIISEIATYQYYINAFNKYFGDIAKLQSLQQSTLVTKQTMVNSILDDLAFVKDFNIQIEKMQKEQQVLTGRQTKKAEIQKQLEDLETEYHIQICPQCQGRGYIE